ncbi:hypothetical protein NUACC21_45000 [Scytonema sp. NUACC21]
MLLENILIPKKLVDILEAAIDNKKWGCMHPHFLSNKEVIIVTRNGNGHKGFFNPVKVFIHILQNVWKKQDKVSGETYLVDSEVVEQDLDDIADQPDRPDNIDN